MSTCYLAAHAPALVVAPVGLSAAQYHTYRMCENELGKLGLTISPAFVYGEELWVCYRSADGRDHQVAEVDRLGRICCVSADSPRGVYAALRALPSAMVGRYNRTVREVAEAAHAAYVEALEAGEDGRIESPDRCAIRAACFELGRCVPDSLKELEASADAAFRGAMVGQDVPLLPSALAVCWLAFAVAVERGTP